MSGYRGEPAGGARDTAIGGRVSAPAAESIRETAKWLTAAFAAVGAVLIAGLQLKDLGQVGPLRQALALGGALLALAAVGVAIASVASVLTSHVTTFTEVTRALYELAEQELPSVAEQARQRPPWKTRVRQLWRRCLERWREGEIAPELPNRFWEQTIDDAEELVPTLPVPQLQAALQGLEELEAERGWSLRRMEAAVRERTLLLSIAAPEAVEGPRAQLESELQALTGAGETVAELADHCAARWTYSRLRFRLGVLGVTAAIGIFVFALATARSQDARRQITQPVPVDVVLSREGQQRFERQLGRGCGTSSFTAVAVAGRFPDVTVAVPPQGQCMAATLELGKGVATVIPRARG